MTNASTTNPPACPRPGVIGTLSAAPKPALCSAVVGLQWGDEGKGKVVDLIAPRFDAIVRYNGGANAGHSVVVKGERYALHLIPSGIMHPGKLAIIANGVVVDPEVLLKEIDGLRARSVDTSGLIISDRAHIVLPYHKAEDELREAVLAGARPSSPASTAQAIGTTKRGIGPAYADKAHRATAIRAMDLARPDVLRAKAEMACAIKNALALALSPAGTAPRTFTADEIVAWASPLGERLAPMLRDTTYLLHDLLNDGKRLLFEGANAALLDVDHGTHPFVTSSSTTALGIPSGSGVPGPRIGEVIGVVKAYSTRVGNGPLPTELLNDTGDRIRQRGREFGTTTGRPRRVGWLDLVAVRYSAMLNGVSSIAIMLLDVLAGFDELKVCTAYSIAGKTTERFPADADELARAVPIYQSLPGFGQDVSSTRQRNDLPDNAKRYVDLVERSVGVPASLVSVGPDREQSILS